METRAAHMCVIFVLECLNRLNFDFEKVGEKQSDRVIVIDSPCATSVIGNVNLQRNLTDTKKNTSFFRRILQRDFGF